MKEYELLRNEIIENYKIISQYNSILFTTVAAVLAVAIVRNTFYLCLVSYIAILPLYLASEAKHRSICRIASYLYVFLKGDDFRWETRQYQFNNGKRRNWKSTIQYYLISVVCSSLAIYKLWRGNYIVETKVIFIIIIAILTLIIVAFMKFNYLSYNKTKEKMISDWQKIKSAEANMEINQIKESV